MLFEYDPNKSASNLVKHGIDFEEAQLLWEDPFALSYKLECSAEERYGLVAHYAGSCWFAVYTYRNESVRLISVRRATSKEIRLYDQIYNER